MQVALNTLAKSQSVGPKIVYMIMIRNRNTMKKSKIHSLTGRIERRRAAVNAALKEVVMKYPAVKIHDDNASCLNKSLLSTSQDVVNQSSRQTQEALYSVSKTYKLLRDWQRQKMNNKTEARPIGNNLNGEAVLRLLRVIRDGNFHCQRTLARNFRCSLILHECSWRSV